VHDRELLAGRNLLHAGLRGKTMRRGRLRFGLRVVPWRHVRPEGTMCFVRRQDVQRGRELRQLSGRLRLPRRPGLPGQQLLHTELHGQDLRPQWLRRHVCSGLWDQLLVQRERGLRSDLGLRQRDLRSHGELPELSPGLYGVRQAVLSGRKVEGLLHVG
jgi:hypothetical protein